MTRDELITELAKYDYPEWCQWVTISNQGYIATWEEIPELYVPYKIWKNLSLQEQCGILNTKAGRVRIDYPEVDLIRINEIQAKKEIKAEPRKPKSTNDWFPGREVVKENIMRMMPDTKPKVEYSCDQCTYETESQDKMIEHYVIHHGSRPSRHLMMGEKGSLIK